MKCFIPKTECLVIKAFNGDLLVTIDEKVYNLKRLSRNEKYSKQFDIIKQIIKLLYLVIDDNKRIQSELFLLIDNYPDFHVNL